ncbi:MAG: helix-turn-helix transcriptional regulator [Gallionellaceae bacterium]
MKNVSKVKEKELAKGLGVLIATKRKSLGLTQAGLAELVGIEQESMSRIETGMVTPSLSRLLSLADALDCTIEDLLRPASGRKQDQSLVLEGLLDGLDEVERAFAVKVIRDLAELSASRRKKSGKV